MKQRRHRKDRQRVMKPRMVWVHYRGHDTVIIDGVAARIRAMELSDKQKSAHLLGVAMREEYEKRLRNLLIYGSTHPEIYG